MASRNLTDVFLLMRKNAVRNKNSETPTRLMHSISLNDKENTAVNRIDNQIVAPLWTDYYEKAHMILPILRSRIADLEKLHSINLHRSTFDDTTEDEIAIENCCHEITRMINEIHKVIQIIKNDSTQGVPKEQRLAVNAYHTLAMILQDLTQVFRATQNDYVKKIEAREDRIRKYFEPYKSESEELDSSFVNSRRVVRK